MDIYKYFAPIFTLILLIIIPFHYFYVYLFVLTRLYRESVETDRPDSLRIPVV